MKKVILLAFLAFGTQQAQAQYKFLQYRNVSEKNEAEFVKRETEYWSKIAKANIDKLEKEAIAAARSKIVNDKLSQDTALAVGNTRAEFEAFIKLEQARWKPVIARAQIKPEGV